MEAAAAEAPGRVEGAAAVAASDHTRAELDRSLVDWQADRSNDFELEAKMLVGLGFVWERWLGLWLARRLENAPTRASLDGCHSPLLPQITRILRASRE